MLLKIFGIAQYIQRKKRVIYLVFQQTIINFKYQDQENIKLIEFGLDNIFYLRIKGNVGTYFKNFSKQIINLMIFHCYHRFRALSQAHSKIH